MSFGFVCFKQKHDANPFGIVSVAPDEMHTKREQLLQSHNSDMPSAFRPGLYCVAPPADFVATSVLAAPDWDEEAVFFATRLNATGNVSQPIYVRQFDPVLENVKSVLKAVEVTDEAMATPEWGKVLDDLDKLVCKHKKLRLQFE